jgi:hypothetical protein
MLETQTAVREAAPPLNPRAGWPADLQQAYEDGRESGVVGTVLVSETEKVRVWHLSIPAGKRCGFHRHVLNYFWTALSDGRARNYFEDGRIVDGDHYKGQTKHLNFGAGEYMVHCVENIGDTDLNFTTVEFLDSPNPPLPIPDDRRMRAPS